MKTMQKYLRLVLYVIFLIIGILFFVGGNLFLIPAGQYSWYKSKLGEIADADTIKISATELNKLNQKVELLNRKIERFTPGNAFLIVNTTENSFRLIKNNQEIRTGLCSTGSFIQLEVDSTKSWIFETPKGALSVKGKIIDPIWRKPDWAFIEEGLPVPAFNHFSRYERGVLGDYALSLGDGYLIHGTLFQRFIGQSVTHGCIRLNDNDLEAVYNNLQVGSKVFIY